MKNLVWDDEWHRQEKQWWDNAITEIREKVDSRDPSMPHGKVLKQTSQGWFRQVVYPYVYGFFYVKLMELAHRYNWHHTRTIHPDGDTLVICSWCGLRSRQ